MVNPSKVIDDRFFADRSTLNEQTGCIEWTRHLNTGGYGTLKHKRKHWMAHRMMWEHKNGPIPDGKIVCHKCDNRRCINPEHLFLGTTQENVDDKMAKGRFAPVLGVKSGMAKLNDDYVRVIRLLGWPQSEIAKLFGISQSNVSMIKTRQAWGHVA